MTVKGNVGTEWVDLLRMKKFNKNVKMPVRGTTGDTGYDLGSAEIILIRGQSRVAVRTGLEISILIGTYACIAPCLGLAVKRSIDVGAGARDTNYNGKLGVILIIIQMTNFVSKKGTGMTS